MARGLKEIRHKLTKEPIKILALGSLFLFFILFTNEQVFSQDCSDQTPEFIVDLSHDPSAVWQTQEFFSPSGACCDLPAATNCAKFIIYLHQDANAVLINLSQQGGTAGNLSYSVDCIPYGYVDETMSVPICLEGSGPHEITFCRQGASSYFATISSHHFEHNVELAPFDGICEDEPMFWFPNDGSYYVDNSLQFYFDPQTYGPGDYQITYVYQDSDMQCIGSASQTLSVYPVPDLVFPELSYCYDETPVELNIATPAGGHYSGNYVVDGFFNPSLSGPGNFEINYSYTSPEGCSAQISSTLSILPLPPADAGTDIIIQQGLNAPLVALDADETQYSYSWAPASLAEDPTSASTATLPLDQTTTFTLTATSSQGCHNNDNMMVIVAGGPLSMVDINATPEIICQGDSIHLSALFGGGSGNFSYSWTSVPPSVIKNPDNYNTVAFPLENTSYTIHVTDNDTGEQVSASVDVVVNIVPEVNLSLPDPQICGNDSLYTFSGGFPEGGYYSIPTLDLYNISSVDPSQLAAGQYLVTYTYSEPGAGCPGQDSEYITVLPKVKAFFYPRQDYCQDNEVTFFNLSENAHTYHWSIEGVNNFNDMPQDPWDYVFPIPHLSETYPVSLTAVSQEGCSQTIVRDVVITEPVLAEISLGDQSGSGCSAHSISFGNNTTGAASFYLWDFGDNSFSLEAQPEHSFEHNGQNDTTYTVVLTAVSANFMCVSQHSVDINVFPEVKADFSINSSAFCHPAQAEILNYSQGASSYYWDLGDETTSISADSILYHSYQNFSDEVAQYQVSLMVENAYGCADSLKQTLEVFPYQQSGFTSQVTEGCAPLTVQFEDDSKGAVNSWFYDFGDGGTSQETSPVHTFHNDTDHTLSFQVMQITDNGFFCPDTSYLTIMVHPEVKADFSFTPAYVCSPSEVSFINNSSGNISSWNWDMGNGTIFNTEEDFISLMYQHNESESQAYSVSLTVANQQGCVDNLVRELVVHPQVEVHFETEVTEGCQPLEVNFNNNTTNALNYFWDFGDGGSSGLLNPAHVYQNDDYSDAQTYTASLLAVSAHQCFDYMEVPIEVFPEVKADFSIDTVAGCSPFEINIDNKSLGAGTLLWNFGDGQQTHADQASISHVYENNTSQPVDFNITLIAENGFGCTDTLSRIITVYPKVTAAFVQTSEGCHPLNVEHENLSENADHFLWKFGPAGSSSEESPFYTYTNESNISPKEYQVSLLSWSAFGCIDSTSATITVNPRPDASFDLQNPHGCSPHEVTIINSTTGADNYLWDFGNGEQDNSSNDTITWVYLSEPGNPVNSYNILLQAVNDYGCTDSLNHQVTVYPQAEAAFSASVIEGCHPLNVDFTNLSPGIDNYSSFHWSYGDGFSSPESSMVHQHTFNNFNLSDTASYQVSLIVNNGTLCSDTTSMTIKVLPSPEAEFTALNPVGCGPHEVFIENNSQGATAYLWDFGDGSTSDTLQTEFSHTFSQPPGQGTGLFDITLLAVNQHNCSREYQQTITVYPEIIASFTSDSSGCHPFTAELTNTSQGAASALWNFGDGNYSHDFNEEHIFFNYSNTETKEYVVGLEVSSEYGCIDYFSDTISVNPVPSAGFDFSSRSGCAPFAPLIYNLSEGATSFLWDFENGTSGSSQNSFSHTWDNTQADPQNYLITLTAENEFGCVDHSMQIINVYPRVIADFTTSDGVFQGCSPFTVQFENLSQLSQRYSWDFQNQQSSSADPLHVFTNNETENAVFPVELIATSVYNCRDTVIKDIIVYPSPVVDFIVTPVIQVYPSTTFTLKNNSSEGEWNYNWDMGDGNQINTDQPNTFEYTYEWEPEDLTTKTYDIILRMDNMHCQDSLSKQVTITSPVPEADFISITKGCPPLAIKFNNLSQHSHSYFWDFDNGSVAMEENPTHIFYETGTYQVMLVAMGDGGVDTTFQNIVVYEMPQADFQIVNPLIDIPFEPLELINRSEGAGFFLWDFGDGNQSEEYQPEHYYQQPGTYTITLIASTATLPQCHDTLSLANGLLVRESCRVVFPNAFKPDPSGPSGGYYNPEDESNSVFYPIYTGLREYNLEIYTRWGELIFKTDDPQLGWDGYFQGKLSKMDVYVWRFSGRCENGESINMTGDVTLIR